MRRLAKLARATDLRDLIALAGLSSLTYGAWLVYAPLGWIVPGLVLLYLGVWHRAQASVHYDTTSE